MDNLSVLVLFYLLSHLLKRGEKIIFSLWILKFMFVRFVDFCKISNLYLTNQLVDPINNVHTKLKVQRRYDTNLKVHEFIKTQNLKFENLSNFVLELK